MKRKKFVMVQDPDFPERTIRDYQGMNKELAFRLAETVQRAGYGITDGEERLDEPKPTRTNLYDELTIVLPKTDVIPGTIWFENETRRATPKKFWHFDLYGNEHAQGMVLLMDSLSKTFGVRVTLDMCVDAIWRIGENPKRGDVEFDYLGLVPSTNQ